MCVRFLNFINFLSNSRTKHWNTHFAKWFKQRKHIFNFLLFSILCKSVGLSSCRTIEPSDYRYAPNFGAFSFYCTRDTWPQISFDSRIETLWIEIIHIINRRKSVWSCLYFCVDCARLIITKKIEYKWPRRNYGRSTPDTALNTKQSIWEVLFLGQGQFSGCPSSLRWTAPEVIQHPRALENDVDSPHTIYSDVYSFGMCMWELAVCEDPFGDISEQEVWRQ